MQNKEGEAMCIYTYWWVPVGYRIRNRKQKFSFILFKGKIANIKKELLWKFGKITYQEYKENFFYQSFKVFILAKNILNRKQQESLPR